MVNYFPPPGQQDCPRSVGRRPVFVATPLFFRNIWRLSSLFLSGVAVPQRLMRVPPFFSLLPGFSPNAVPYQAYACEPKTIASQDTNPDLPMPAPFTFQDLSFYFLKTTRKDADGRCFNYFLSTPISSYQLSGILIRQPPLPFWICFGQRSIFSYKTSPPFSSQSLRAVGFVQEESLWRTRIGYLLLCAVRLPSAPSPYGSVHERPSSFSLDPIGDCFVELHRRSGSPSTRMSARAQVLLPFPPFSLRRVFFSSRITPLFSRVLLTTEILRPSCTSQSLLVPLPSFPFGIKDSKSDTHWSTASRAPLCFSF